MSIFERECNGFFVFKFNIMYLSDTNGLSNQTFQSQLTITDGDGTININGNEICQR